MFLFLFLPFSSDPSLNSSYADVFEASGIVVSERIFLFQEIKVSLKNGLLGSFKKIYFHSEFQIEYLAFHSRHVIS